jgi:hypothetical protein
MALCVPPQNVEDIGCSLLMFSSITVHDHILPTRDPSGLVCDVLILISCNPVVTQNNSICLVC